MKYLKSELEEMAVVLNLPYAEIGKKYGVSGVFIRKKCLELGIDLSHKSIHKSKIVPHNKGRRKNRFFCSNCSKEILNRSKCQNPKFCDNKCQGDYVSRINYLDFIDNQEKYDGRVLNIKCLKPHILREQKNLCHICEMKNEWNGKELMFVLDHIDGNCSNNKRENLRLICHNCDSQLPTYKSKNKNSARKNRYNKF